MQGRWLSVRNRKCILRGSLNESRTRNRAATCLYLGVDLWGKCAARFLACDRTLWDDATHGSNGSKAAHGMFVDDGRTHSQIAPLLRQDGGNLSGCSFFCECFRFVFPACNIDRDIILVGPVFLCLRALQLHVQRWSVGFLRSVFVVKPLVPFDIVYSIHM